MQTSSLFFCIHSFKTKNLIYLNFHIIKSHDLIVYPHSKKSYSYLRMITYIRMSCKVSLTIEFNILTQKRSNLLKKLKKIEDINNFCKE